MTRLTNQQLEALKEEQNWKALWTAAIPWVHFAAGSLHTDDKEDLIQDGLLHVGAQIRKWEPKAGRFSTFVVNVARNVMLVSLKRRDLRRNSMTQMPEEDPSAEDHRTVTPPTYEATDHTPEGFGDPAKELSREFSHEAAETLLTELNAGDSLRLREYLGLATIDAAEDPVPVGKMAVRHNIPQQAMSRELIEIHETLKAKLRERQREQYMKNSNWLYPPKGRIPWRTNIPADRFPGFWSGMAGVIGDADAWRESTGSVWKDWSWKPTDFDILNGAKP